MEQLARKFLLCEYFHHLLLLVFCFILVVDASTVVVDSPFGKIKGVKKIDEKTGQSYLSFKGIPYAKPPVGDLRFAKPQPHPNIGTFDATKDNKIICPHFDSMTFGETDFTEDCLILNIYVTDVDLTNNNLKKVLVYIHGGGFKASYSTFYDPKSFVISEDVIVVTINYRLGILGFLSTENEASPGNYGLWDQTLAIKWVKDNIRAFGGDPDDITIAGQSSGGTSVGLHAISSHANGTFTKVYVHSGFATSNFAISFNAQRDALSAAKSAGCWEASVNDAISIQQSKTVIECLRNAPLSAITAFWSGVSLTDVQFAPRVDGDFISDTPDKLIQDDEYLNTIGFFDRTYLTGINNNEATAQDSSFQIINMLVSTDPNVPVDDRETTVTSYLKQIENAYIKSRLDSTAALNQLVSQKIHNFYDRRFTQKQAFREVTTDISFLLPSFDLLRATSARDNCRSYFLYFDYFPEFMKGSHTGVPHGGDLLFLFDLELNSLENIIHAGIQGQMGAEDLEVKSMFFSLLGEFVRSGNPGLALDNIIPCGWPKYDVTNSQYLNFNPKPWIGSFLEKDKQDLWLKTAPRLMGKTDVVDDTMSCPVDGSPIFASCYNVVAFSFLFIVIVCTTFF